MSNGNTVTVQIVGGQTITVPWTQGMNAQQALEGAFNQGTKGFTYALQYYGNPYGYLVLMINETYETFNAPSGTSESPFYYWEFLYNGTPASTGIDGTILNSGDTISFELQLYSAEEHANSSLRVKHESRTKASARK
jgi:hypothetical protein